MWKRLILIAICLNSVFVHAQLEGHNWVFWDSVGLSFVTDSLDLIYNYKFPTGDLISVSDMSGALQLITNGKNVWDKDFEILEDTMNNGLYFENGYDFFSSTSSIIVDNKVYSIYLYADWVIDNGSIRAALFDLNIGEFIYIDSIIDIYTISSFSPIYNLRALRHGNGRDWWIVTFGTNEFHEYPMPIGLNFSYMVSYTKGVAIESSILEDGEIKFKGDFNEFKGPFEFSQSGDTFFKAFGKNGYLYQFDRCTGAIVLVDSLMGVDSIEIASIAFSNDDSKLYLTTTTSYIGIGLPYSPSSIYQYCLDCGVDVASTKDTIYQFPTNKYQFSGMKLGPDGKIYLTAAKLDLAEDDPLPDYQTHFWVINHPDSLGAACDLDTASISSGGRNLASSFPNIPNYQLGPWRGSPCDTLEEFNAVIETSALPFKAYPNPVQDYLFIDNPLQTTCQAVVYNAMGQEVERFIVQVGGQTVSTTTWPTGIYQLIIQQENSNIWKQSVVKMEPR
jgi:hypothetical protein